MNRRQAFDTTFEKDIIRDVKCRLTVNIIDHRPCYCGAELREVWRESEEISDHNKKMWEEIFKAEREEA